MTEDLALAPSTNLPGSFVPEMGSGTRLLDFPENALFRIWRMPQRGVEPIDEGSISIGKLIPTVGRHILICFGTMIPDNWNAIREALTVGSQLKLSPILVATLDTTSIACGLWGAKQLAGLHKLTHAPSLPTVFSPNRILMRILGIDHDHRTRNALVLVLNGRIVATWISGSDGEEAHDWTKILSIV